jgi:predicted CoA-substrate-specific enzyme activase
MEETMAENTYLLGIDVGSTTVKCVVLDENYKILHSDYQRHFSKIKDAITKQLSQIDEKFKNAEFKIAITGSAGLGLAESADITFVQEVHAAFLAVNKRNPKTDVVIELGGEDAKILFLTGGTEQRMNGSCAGGTGAFIDQMATLLDISADEMDEMSERAEKIYPIASRCGVFAKSDIQPLLNQGAKREDIAASIFQAVVEQTVSGLAQGRKIQGNVLFLGGPLSFLKGLRKAFVETLNLDDAHAEFPKEAPVYVAYGSAVYAQECGDELTISQLFKKLENARETSGRKVEEPLFVSKEQYDIFVKEHQAYDVPRGHLQSYKGKAYLGFDAGSTTTKAALIAPDGTLLYSYYSQNKGQPLDRIHAILTEIYTRKNPELEIAGAAVTGYGEDLIKAGFSVDYGIVETVAHFKAAKFFCPDVDFIMDIGGQDIKCFKIKNNTIDSIMLNEACSSGCGSFIQTFAAAMGYTISDFAKLGIYAKAPVNLGSRCTVFMNSSVKQAQKDGATVEDISAGLSSSIIKNAIYKVIRVNSPDDLGKHVVVQGGTFLNDAVLRAFEKEMGRTVVRPVISGLMGAFGAALYAMEQNPEKSTIISPEQLRNFEYKSKSTNCRGCTAKCSLNIINFNNGQRFISGNRCERGAGVKTDNNIPCLYEYKYNTLMHYGDKNKVENPIAKVGIPRALSFYEQIPFWDTLFTTLGFEVVYSEESSRETYFKGQQTIPSDTVCYPAKLAHGHIESLLDKNVDFIFYPCMSYNMDEGENDNHYNCPVVAYYPELLKANNERLNDNNFIYPYMDISIRKNMIDVIYKTLGKYNLNKKKVAFAVDKAYEALESYHEDIRNEAVQIIEQARKENRKIIVLAGRPYHIDKEINHGINKLITSLGLAVITEDSIAHLAHTPELKVLNQWTYHSRLYRAAAYVAKQPDMQLIQLVSFGCGIDAITTDEVRRILESNGKLYTQLKIDEISNLGAVKIRLRSLVAAMGE